ncbi:hypothetical protein ACQEU6_12650 [Spirillospora sp. CA-108201]
MIRTPMLLEPRAAEPCGAPGRDGPRAGSAAPPVPGGPAPAGERGEGT